MKALSIAIAASLAGCIGAKVHDPGLDAGAEGSDGGADAGCTTECNPLTGTCAPASTCSTSSPCHSITSTITNATATPLCHTTSGSRPLFDDGAPLSWTDSATAEPRSACVFRPLAASASSTRPLLLYIHGTGATADDIYNLTSLRAKAPTDNLSNDPARPGFFLAADQGRELHWPVGEDGTKHDFLYRDFHSPSANPDFRNVDKLIDDLAAQGGVDEKRIYVTGWSNGAYWAAQYAIVRHDQATPGGHVVAAAAVYAGADPFADFDATASPSCRPSTYPQTQVPLLIIHRNCDALVACDSTQRTAFNLPPQSDVEGFLSTLAGAGADLHTQDLIIDRNGAVVSACDPTCSRLQGTLNHVRWPDGVADNGGQDHELDLLAFLRANPHP